jgi:hypothetical protein
MIDGGTTVLQPGKLGSDEHWVTVGSTTVQPSAVGAAVH